MIRNFLVRGMLVGAIAGIVAFGFARYFGEPLVDVAIGFEEAAHHHEMSVGAAADQAGAGSEAAASEAYEPELVSRPVQAGLGLFTAVVIYGAAFGGLFALAFAFAFGRIGTLAPRPLALLLAALCFVLLVVIPALKYPPNPPAVGAPETIGLRSGLFLLMVAGSLAAALIGATVRGLLVQRLGGWNATLAGIGVFIVGAAVVAGLLPVINEGPEGFPASVLWQFRVTSLGIQTIMWAIIGLMFGALTQRQLARGAS